VPTWSAPGLKRAAVFWRARAVVGQYGLSLSVGEGGLTTSCPMIRRCSATSGLLTLRPAAGWSQAAPCLWCFGRGRVTE